MRLKCILMLFLVLSALVTNAQEIGIEKDASKIKAPKSYELPSEQYNAWKKVEDGWRSEYVRILKEQKLKMSCSGCESVQMDVILTIDAEGKLKHYRLLKSDKCSEPFSKALELRFMKYFFNLQFPVELKGVNVEVKLGTGLKC